MTDDVKIEVGPNNDTPTMWRSACVLMDKNAVQYFTTIGIITGIMGFSIYKLSTNESCESQTAYMGLLTLLLGILSPSPVFKKSF